MVTTRVGGTQTPMGEDMLRSWVTSVIPVGQTHPHNKDVLTQPSSQCTSDLYLACFTITMLNRPRTWCFTSSVLGTAPPSHQARDSCSDFTVGLEHLRSLFKFKTQNDTSSHFLLITCATQPEQFVECMLYVPA